jgi:hypothetical protein
MKIFNILITILSAIVIYIIFKNYNNKKIEKFTSTETCTASLTDWGKTNTLPTGNELTHSKWDPLKTELLGSNNDVVSFTFRNDLFSDVNYVLDYTIDINDYLKIERDSNIEYWKPIKKWKDGVVSHFCKELCILKLGYEWIKTDDITGLIKLTNDIENGGIGTEKTNAIKQLIILKMNSISSSYSLNANKQKIYNEYIKLDTDELDNIIGSDYINHNNYIDIGSNIYYKVVANIPIGRKWKVYSGNGSYLSTDKDILYNITDDNYFYNLNNIVSVGDIIILSETEYDDHFRDITERHVIHPSIEGICFMPELFEYDFCYEKTCSIFANKEFDDYLKLLNLRESVGYKSSSFEHRTDIMNNSGIILLDLVNALENAVKDRDSNGICTTSVITNKLIEVINSGEYVRNDNSIDIDNCPKTYDPYSYVSNISANICDELDEPEYRKKINPEIYSYITTEWLDHNDNANYNFEKNWNNIKDNIDLTQKSANESLKNKIISKNQLSELIVKYLDNTEQLLHDNYRKPFCITHDDDTQTCYGDCIIIEDPNTEKLMDSKNKKLDNVNEIDLYTDSDEDDEYIRMGKIASTNYILITDENKDRVGGNSQSGSYITNVQCDTNINNATTDNAVILDDITDLTDEYYTNLLNYEKLNITNLNDEINNINTNITSTYNNLCSKYEDDEYKLYTNYDIVEFNKDNSLDKNNNKNIDLNTLVQKTILLKLISPDNISKIFNTVGVTDEISCEYEYNECRNLGDISDIKKYNILNVNKNIIGDEITISLSLNDFYKVVNTVNILKNDYLYLVQDDTYYKIIEIYDDDIAVKINNHSLGNYIDTTLSFTYNDFVSINIDLNSIDIDDDDDKIYYITLNTNDKYVLNMDDTFKKFIRNYKSIYEVTTNIELTNTERCINNTGQVLFAENDAISNEPGQSSCTTNHSCKEDIDFSKRYTPTQYQSIESINFENKKSWDDNNHITDYDNIYKEAVGYDLTPDELNNKDFNTYSNYWKNKYHNEHQCPPYGYGIPSQFNDLYYVNQAYNYGLKWKKLSSDIDNIDKIIIQIYDTDVLNTSLVGNENIIDFTIDRNNIRFKNNVGNIISMSDITNNYRLKISNDFYEVYGSNKCSNSQICSIKSNNDYKDEFNTHVENIYSDQQLCNTLNTEYNNHYSDQKTTLGYDISSDDFENSVFYPNHDPDFQLYEFSPQATSTG